MERILNATEKTYKNMEAIAAMLTATSKKGIIYRVKDTYLDFGQDWKWTTICYESEWGGCQILSPRQWEEIDLCDSPEELYQIFWDIRNDKYFTDK